MLNRRVGVSCFMVSAVAAFASGCGGNREATKMRAVEHGPLVGAEVMAFAATRDGAAARAFYEGKLGLRVLGDDAMAIMLDSGGTVIRIQKIRNHEPERFTVLGWRVDDIRATAARFAKAGVKLERYEWMKMQDETGVATFPGGDMVAWFLDPDGNILSIAQFK